MESCESIRGSLWGLFRTDTEFASNRVSLSYCFPLYFNYGSMLVAVYTKKHTGCNESCIFTKKERGDGRCNCGGVTKKLNRLLGSPHHCEALGVCSVRQRTDGACQSRYPGYLDI